MMFVSCFFFFMCCFWCFVFFDYAFVCVFGVSFGSSPPVTVDLLHPFTMLNKASQGNVMD